MCGKSHLAVRGPAAAPPPPPPQRGCCSAMVEGPGTTALVALATGSAAAVCCAAQRGSAPELDLEPQAAEGAQLMKIAAHRAKHEWAEFIALALPASQDLSANTHPPSWASLEGGSHGCESAKPLWLALLAHDGVCVRASLDTFENLDDKVVLARALKSAGTAHIAPPTLVFEADTPRSEIERVIQASPPQAIGPNHEPPAWVLKWAQGFGGQDVFFVHTAEEAAAIIGAAHDDTEQMREAMPGMASEEAQPGWVLQSMVPSVLIEGRKLHIRSYVVGLRGATEGSPVEFYAYHRHEVRLAAAPYTSDLSDINAHLTTGVWRRGGVKDDRTTLDAVPSLQGLVSPDALLRTLDTLFSSLPITQGMRGGLPPTPQDPKRKTGIRFGRIFGISGIDIMVTPSGELYVLEINASPAAAPPETIAKAHVEHLVGFARGLVELVFNDEPGKVAGFTPVGRSRCLV